MARKTKAEALRTKEQLLESALEVMSENSYSNISMTELAERKGYSKGAIYWHFRNKHDVLINLVDAYWSKTEGDLAKLISAGQNLAALRAFFKSKMAVPGQNEIFKKFHKLMLRRHEWPDNVCEKVNNILANRIEKECRDIEKILVKLQKDGEIKGSVNTRETSMLISAVFQGIFMWQIDDSFYRMDFTKYVDIIFDAIDRQLTSSEQR